MNLTRFGATPLLVAIVTSIVITGCETPTDDSSRVRLDDNRSRSIDTIESMSSGSTFAGMSDPLPREIRTSAMESAFRNRNEGSVFLRAACEFVVIPTKGEVERATLHLTESRVAIARPMPPDEHVIYAYLCDYVITSADHERPAVEIGRFTTDVNDPPHTIAIDVTESARKYFGTGVGFRVQLASDPIADGTDSLGTTFAGYGEPGEPILVMERVQ